MSYKLSFTGEQIDNQIRNCSPKVGSNNHWLVWDINSSSWADTGIAATGAKGDKGDKGDSKSPYIGTNGNWWVFNDTTKTYQDSGVGAEGEVTGGVADVRIGGQSVVNTSGVANVDAVRYDTAQSLTDSAKQVARTNIGAGNPLGTIAGGKNLANNPAFNSVIGWNPCITIPSGFTFEQGKTYTISFDTPNTGVEVYFYFYTHAAQGIQPRILNGSRQSITVTITTTVTTPTIISNRGGSVATGLCSNLQIEQGDTATAYEPYYPSNLQLGRKQNIVNLLNPTGASSGIITKNGDGTYTLNGSTGITQFSLTIAEVYLNKGTYKICGVPKGTDAYIRLGVGAGNTHVTGVNANDYILNVTEYNLYKLNIILPANKTANNVVFKPMITTNLSATYDDFIEYGHYVGGLQEDYITSAYAGEVRILKNGFNAILSIRVGISTSTPLPLNAWTTIGTTKFAPKYEIKQICIGSGGAIYQVEISTSGQIRVYNYSSTGQIQGYAQVPYICN